MIGCRRLRRATAPEAPPKEGLLFCPHRGRGPREGSFCDQSHEPYGVNVRLSLDDLTIALVATDSRLEAGMGFSVSP